MLIRYPVTRLGPKTKVGNSLVGDDQPASTCVLEAERSSRPGRGRHVLAAREAGRRVDLEGAERLVTAVRDRQELARHVEPDLSRLTTAHRASRSGNRG